MCVETCISSNTANFVWKTWSTFFAFPSSNEVYQWFSECLIHLFCLLINHLDSAFFIVYHSNGPQYLLSSDTNLLQESHSMFQFCRIYCLVDVCLSRDQGRGLLFQNILFWKILSANSFDYMDLLTLEVYAFQYYDVICVAVVILHCVVSCCYEISCRIFTLCNSYKMFTILCSSWFC